MEKEIIRVYTQNFVVIPKPFLINSLKTILNHLMIIMKIQGDMHLKLHVH